uniref:Uncharacterized protein n=1 Tax=uncultured Thiotrichaceae bacterium TaxID=298394 RepID=A0A6S6TJZ6_9GAMM|nr:MAG: Unknown protein [uncultured Thiotrichaceae bacterium]
MSRNTYQFNQLADVQWDKKAIVDIAQHFAEVTDLIATAEWRQFANSTLPPRWNIRSIRKVWSCTVGPFRKNLPAVASKKRFYFQGFSATERLLALPVYGKLCSDQSMFRYNSVQWGFSFTEPQITKSLAYFLKRSPSACWYFLAALFRCDPLLLEAKILVEKVAFLKTASVDVEVATEKGKRIDLVIFWCSPTGQKSCIVIECKLGYSLSDGQLENYTHFVRHESECAQYHMFVVAQRRDAKTDEELSENEEWRYREWEGVLRRWECYITSDENRRFCDEPEMGDFARFRRTIWERTTRSW